MSIVFVVPRFVSNGVVIDGVAAVSVMTTVISIAPAISVLVLFAVPVLITILVFIPIAVFVLVTILVFVLIAVLVLVAILVFVLVPITATIPTVSVLIRVAHARPNCGIRRIIRTGAIATVSVAITIHVATALPGTAVARGPSAFAATS